MTTTYGPDAPQPAVQRADVAKGAGMAALARFGGLIELVSQPLFTWLYGLAGYGLYAVLWALVNVSLNVVNLSMELAMQRLLPASASAQERCAVVRTAMMIVISLSVIAALAICWQADAIAAVLSVSPEQRAHLPFAISLFAWTLPLAVIVETATGAVRAMRAFGPEIRLRIMWEQIARLLFAVSFFAIGFNHTGLLMGHLASLSVTAALSLRLLGNQFGWGLLVAAPRPHGLIGRVIRTGLALMPTTLGRRALNDLPTVALNLMVPGAAGAIAAGLFVIARKIASVPLAVRQPFLYVLAPLAAEQAAQDRRHIAPLYSFATHISLMLAGYLTIATLLLSRDILALFSGGAQAALPMVVALLCARLFEAVFGPASPIVEMTGHPVLPLVNSAAGVTTWAALAFWLVPTMGAAGMAVAVAAGVVIVTGGALVEMMFLYRLTPFSAGFGRCLAVLAVAGGVLWAASWLLSPLGHYGHAAGLIAVGIPLFWAALRLGLGHEDKAALGPIASRLRIQG